MKTSSWFTKLPPGHVGVGISRSVPTGLKHLPNYRKLAPGAWFKSCASPQEYAQRYFSEILAQLDPGQVVADLQRLAIVPHGGRWPDVEPVLLCWEAPPPAAAWCHRALVSAWLFDTLAMGVPELGHEHLGHGWQHPKLHRTLADSRSLTQARFDVGPPSTPR
jgi:hypothetical protein